MIEMIGHLLNSFLVSAIRVYWIMITETCNCRLQVVPQFEFFFSRKGAK